MPIPYFFIRDQLLEGARISSKKLKKEHGWAVTHEDKSLEVQSFFQSTMQHPQPRQVEINYGIFNSQQYNLSSLDMPFTEAEIKKSIDLLLADKALGPDGFMGTFFKSCWDIIKNDVMEAVKAFHDLRCMNLQLINSGNIILLPKKEGAEAVGDFRPISLIHSFVKIINKTLALRLAPHMHEIVSPCQSAFIKKRTIQDNFMVVRSAVRRYQRMNIPSLFLKLDIVKSFDSVRWEYLLSLLQHLGFPSWWRDWIAAILSTST
jgi:hypothetical protein